MVVLTSFLATSFAQEAFRDTEFTDSCQVAEAKMLAYDDTTPVYTCEQTAGGWFTVEVDQLFYHDRVQVSFNYNTRDNGEFSNVVIQGRGVTMVFIGTAKETLTQVHGLPTYENPRQYSLTTLQAPDPETGIANRVLYEWLTAEEVTITLMAGVSPLNPDEGVISVIIIERPKADAWQF